jgi:nitrate/nitrite transport system permease protein
VSDALTVVMAPASPTAAPLEAPGRGATVLASLRMTQLAVWRHGRPWLVSLAWGAASMALLLAAWQTLCATVGRDLPTPLATGRTLAAMLADPFNPDRNSLGIGLQLWESLRRVAVGFGLGSAIAIPLGVLMGASPVAKRLLDPMAQILRPVSPLVWFPLALVAFKAVGGTATASLFTILITSLWPTLISTAFGVSSVPEDYRTVARVFQFTRDRYLLKVLIPHALPHILTGLRVSMGIAWLVIVATEMLSGGVGIGFFAWDSYNAGSYEKMVAAVILIGVVGLVLDRAFEFALRRLQRA